MLFRSGKSMLEGESASFVNSAGGRASTGQSRRDPRAALGQQQLQQVPAPAPLAPPHDGGLAEGDTAALAAQLAAGGDSAMRLQQILANLPVVGTAEQEAFPLHAALMRAALRQPHAVPTNPCQPASTEASHESSFHAICDCVSCTHSALELLHLHCDDRLTDHLPVLTQ